MALRRRVDTAAINGTGTLKFGGGGSLRNTIDKRSVGPFNRQVVSLPPADDSNMPTTNDVVSILEQFAPSVLAEEWDNVGLLVGDRDSSVRRVMTCLTVTGATVEEAIERGADLVVSHHPLPFTALKRITTDSHEGRLLLKLIKAGVAVYSPHTAFDSATAGINQHLATAIDLADISPLVPAAGLDDAELGAGRVGNIAGGTPLTALVDRLKIAILVESIRVVGEDDQKVTRVGVACGAGSSLLDAAIAAGCDCFLTGEASFHTCIAAEAAGLAVVLTGHFASERFALDVLAEYLAHQLPDVEVWGSRNERDPLRWA